jgi:hypothetical protein
MGEELFAIKGVLLVTVYRSSQSPECVGSAKPGLGAIISGGETLQWHAGSVELY